jgi:hypothetical protein
LPGWNGFAIVPNDAVRPAACVPATPSAFASCAAFRPSSFAGRRRRAEVAEVARDVPAALRHPPADLAADPRLHFEARDERGEHVGAGKMLPLAQREHDRRDGRRAVDDRRQVRVVEVERVRLGPVRHRGEERARLLAARDDRRLRLAAGRVDHLADRDREWLDGAADRGAEPVGHRALRAGDDVGRERGKLEVEHEFDECVHHRRVHRVSLLTRSEGRQH